VRRFLAAAALAAVVFVPTAAGTGIVDLGKTTYTDVRGDSGKAADLKSVVVSNDDMGDYSFTATFAAPLVPEHALLVYLNTDREASTGNSDGAEYVVAVSGDGDIEFDRWTGSHWVWNGYAGVTLGNPLGTKVIDFSIRKHDIGGVRHFDFFVVSQRTDNVDDHDDGPSAGHGMWRYDFAAPAIANAGSFATSATAGKTWTVGLRARQSNTGRTITSGKIFCVAAPAANGTLPVLKASFRRYRGDTYATCEFAIPKALKGKFVGSRIDITANGATASRHFHSTAR
jgi:hypothetical protein